MWFLYLNYCENCQIWKVCKTVTVEILCHERSHENASFCQELISCRPYYTYTSSKNICAICSQQVNN